MSDAASKLACATLQTKNLLAFLLFVQLQGNTAELANHHSASRVIQWCLKEASVADKKRLLDEIKTNIVPLSKSTYGRHVVQKVISNASKEEVPGKQLYTGVWIQGVLVSTSSCTFQLLGPECIPLGCRKGYRATMVACG